MSGHRWELEVPPQVHDDPKAFEIARIFAANRQQYVVFHPNMWTDPDHWGLMLADFARHVANALQQETGADPEDTISRIQSMLAKELGKSTSPVRREWEQ